MKSGLGIVLLLVGVGAGYGFSEALLGDSSHARPAPPTSPQVAPPALEPHTQTPGSAVERVSSGEAPESQDLGALLRALPRADVGSRDGTVRGSVVTESGEPLAGVRIELRVRGAPERSVRRSASETTLTEFVTQAVQQHHYQNALLVVIETDAGGAFLAPGLIDEEYFLEARRDGYRIESRRGSRGTRVRPGDIVELVARRIVTVTLDVRYPDGARAERAQIQLGRGSRNRTIGWRVADPEVEIERGNYELTASVGDEYSSAPEPLIVTDHASRSEIVFHLRPRLGLRGRVVVPEGEVPRDYLVRWILLPSGGAPDLEVLAASSHQGRVSAADRSFKFLDLVSGTYAVGVGRGERRIDSYVIIEIAAGIAETELVIPPLDRSDVLVIWVRGADGELLRDFNVHPRYQASRRGGSIEHVDVRHRDGSAWLLIEEETFWQCVEGKTEGSASVSVSAAGLGSKEVAVTGQEVTIDFRPPAELEVHVSNYVGSGFEGRVSVALERREGGSSRTTLSTGTNDSIDGQGNVKVGPVEAGEYDLALAVGNGPNNWASLEVERIPVTLNPGFQRIIVSLPPLYTLTVEFPVVESELQVGLQPLVRSSRASMSQLDQSLREPGTVTFAGVPPGGYRLHTFSFTSMEFMNVQVEGNTHLRFEPIVVNALEVLITESEGTLIDLGFQDGDKITAIDGKNFEGAMQLQAMMMETSAKGTVELTVQRGASRVILQVDGKRLMGMGQEGMGGRIDPASYP